MGKAKKIIIALVLILLAGGAVYTYVPLEDIPYLGAIIGGETSENRSEIQVISKRIKVTPPANVNTSQDADSDDIVEEVVVAPIKVAKPAPKPRPAVKKATPKPATKPAVTTAKTRPSQKPYIINVASFKTKAEALQLKDTLRKGGYNVYRTEFVKDGVKWHRVRLGFYPSRAGADRVSTEVGKKYGVTGGWVTKPSWSEYDAYAK